MNGVPDGTVPQISLASTGLLQQRFTWLTAAVAAVSMMTLFARHWYRWNAFPFGLILDHGLHSGNLRCGERKILPPNGSDHRALVLDFSANDLH